jgi:predicted RNA-binding Zn ribbon-like protein
MPGTVSQTLFDLAGGHPALDLVNSLDNRFRHDGPNEVLVGYEELLRFLGESALLDEHQIRLLSKTAHADGKAAEHALRSVRDLREAGARVLYAAVAVAVAPMAADLKTLQQYFREASQHRELHWQPAAQAGRHPPHVTWRWPDSEAVKPALPLWILSQSVADLLLSDRMVQLRTCAVDTCRWLFLDTSKNHTRRWCNMKVCGNRMKARRFQARR